MNRKLILIFIILPTFLRAQVDSLTTDSTRSYSFGNEITLTYEHFNNRVSATTDELIFNFHDAIHWIGFEQNMSDRWSEGLNQRIFFKGLWSNTTFKTSQGYKLKGFRTGYNTGYKFLFWNWLVLEPMICFEYVNLRIKDKLTKSKLKNNGIKLATNSGLFDQFRSVNQIP